MSAVDGMSLVEHWIALRPERAAQSKHSPAAYMTSAEEAERFRANGWEILGPLTDNRGAVEEAEKWKRIAQDRCTCVKTCGDTPEDSGGICKELPRDRGQ